MMTVKIPKTERTVFSTNRFLKYEPAFEKLSTKEMLFVILYMDPNSPLLHRKTTMPDLKFRELVCKRIGVNSTQSLIRARELIIEGKYKPIEEAIVAYRYMCPGADMIQTYQSLYRNVRKLLQSDDPTDIKNGISISKTHSLEVLRDKILDIKNGVTMKTKGPQEAKDSVTSKKDYESEWDPNKL
jgi:hypothetical protein